MKTIDGIIRCRHKPVIRDPHVVCEIDGAILTLRDLRVGDIIPFNGQLPRVVIDGDRGTIRAWQIP